MAGFDGIVHNFVIYCGKTVQPPGLADIGACGNVVIRLSSIVPKHRNYKLYFDNWFCGLKLQVELAKQEIQSLGTVRANRLPGSDMKSDAELNRSGCGFFRKKNGTVEDVVLHVVKCYNNRSVTLLSTYIGAKSIAEVQRWDRFRSTKVAVQCPAVVKKYNQYMGGVDLLDSLIALYRIKIRSKKWYHRLLFHFIDMTVVTSWLLYWRDCSAKGVPKAEQMRLAKFRSQLAEALCKTGKSLEKKKGRHSTSVQTEYEAKRKKKGPRAQIPVADLCLDNTAHWPTL
ncbi:PiggyBac transposable element-derived protein 1 [Acipenser ruthenus]|uniref:PiggyBac transposable element-derived protein 1 n=1 Tax=Acipenser ruthenus TaxID=7906 RepID=A0A444U5F8_ACIRT|nr:PiggyBac transposable element-derived protein 1 [Acipenser ruthenus]